MTPGTERQNKMENPYDPMKAREAIHSGHFMVSDIDDTEAPDDDDNISIPALDAEDRAEVVPENRGFNFDKACKETSDTYMFGPRYTKSISIDATLTKLFQCMSIAYSGKLTSPRWKNFKGLKLRWKDKIRLNNVIWRAWHMQFVKKKSPVVCQFASPLDGDTHNKPEAVVLEGKYWKRRLETVCAEYKKWRLFYKAKPERCNRAMSDAGFDMDFFNWQPRSNQSFHSSSSMVIDDDPLIDFTDTLFSSLIPSQPFAFPNPREIARAGLADLIQPGLVQLQPNLDDFMDTFDMFAPRITFSDDCSLQEFLSTSARLDLITNTTRNLPVNQDCFNSSILPQSQDSVQLPTTKIFPENSSLTSYGVEENDFMDTQLSNVDSGPKIENSLAQELDPVSKSRTIQVLPLISDNQTLCSNLVPPPDSNSLGLPLGSSGGQQQTQNFTPSQSQSQTFSPSQSQSFSPPHEDLFLVSQSASMNSVSHPKSTSSKYVNILPAPPNSASSSSIMTPFLEGNSIQLLQQPSTPTVLVSQRTSSDTKSTSLLKSSALNHTEALNTAKQDVFIMPKQTTARMRSRSMSGPQPSSTGLMTFSPTTTNHTFPSTPAVVSSVTPVLPQNALLAQLLTTGTYLQKPKEELPATSSSVTIISTVANPQPAQAVIISPATLTPVNELSSQIIQGSPDQLISQNNAVSTLALSVTETNISNKIGNSLKSQILPNNRASLEMRTSPPKPFRPKSDTERVQYREHRRVCHINAEQKRRCNIKTGFDTLHNLIPSLSQNPNAKVSKAAMLQKAGEYIVQLRSERTALQEEADLLRKQIESLNQAIGTCQAQLPASGAPISRQRESKLKDMFDEYVRKRTQQNWKFWIFSILIQPLLDSYNNAVSTASVEELCHTVLSWLEQHCSLVALRPAVLNSLRHLSTTTNILTDPTNISQEAVIAVTKPTQRRQ